MSTLNLQISFDINKSNQNEVTRGLSFKLAMYFDWSSALITPDNRIDYGEARYLAMGLIEARLHAIVFTPREQTLHIISLRKANSREVNLYGQEKKF